MDHGSVAFQSLEAGSQIHGTVICVRAIPDWLMNHHFAFRIQRKEFVDNRFHVGIVGHRFHRRTEWTVTSTVIRAQHNGKKQCSFTLTQFLGGRFYIRKLSFCDWKKIQSSRSAYSTISKSDRLLGCLFDVLTCLYRRCLRYRSFQ